MGGNNSTDVVINTTDSKPELSFVADSVDVVEGDIASFTVSLSRPSVEDVTGKLIITSATASAGEDYNFTNSDSFTIAAGETSQTVEVKTLTTGSYRVEKSLKASLSSSADNIRMGGNNSTDVVINTTDSKPVLIVENTTVDEGDKTDVTVRLTRAFSEDVAVSWRTIDDTASSDRNVDYQYNFGSLDFEANTKDADHNIEVQTYKNGPYKPNKQFYIKLYPSDTHLDIEELTVTIDVTNSRPKISFVGSHVEVTEGEPVNLEVSLTRLSSQTVHVNYQIIEGASLLEFGTDTFGTLTFAPDDDTQSISFKTLHSDTYHAGNSLTVKLLDPTNADIGNNVTTVTVKFAVPEKPELKVTFDKAKTFSFSWDESPRATYYKLFEALDGALDFNEVDEAINIINTTYDHIVPLYKRVNARYKLQSCNQAGCSEFSENVSISEILANITSSIGVIDNEDDDYDHNELFGSAVSLSDDGETIAVGAFKDSSNKTGVTNSDGGQAIDGAQNQDGATASGAVYIYKRDENNTWAIEAYIKAGNAEADDYFGHSISLSTDGNTLAVGAYMEDASTVGVHDHPVNNNDAEYSGAVYIYKRGEDNTWAIEAYIKASNAQAGDYFGKSVSLDANGTTLAVGAYGEDAQRVVGSADYNLEADNNEKNSGATYVFTATNDKWTQEAYIKASTTGMGDYFGFLVSLSADGATLAVAAHPEDSDATGINGNPSNDTKENSGAVFVFIRGENNDWPQQAYIKASNTDQNDQFGEAISLSHDGNTLAVSAYREDSDSKGINEGENNNDANDSGAVYVFSRVTGWKGTEYQDNQSPWSQQAYIKASNAGDNDWFGNRLSLSDDGKTLAVSATEEDSNETGINQSGVFAEVNDSTCCSNSGAVYIFTRVDSKWLEKTYIKAKNPEVRDNFGKSVTLSGKGNTLVVGSEATAASDIFDKVYIY